MEKEIKIFGKKVTLHLRNEGDLAVSNELFLDHQYRFCDDVIRKAKDAVIDIGGHLGFFSLYAGLLNTNVPIYAFEPHEGNYSFFKRNIKGNRIKNVVSKQVAVSSMAGQAELQLSKEDFNHSLQRAIDPTGDMQNVQTTTLERIFDKNRIECCNLIKIDCEGAEFEIIRSAPNWVFEKTDAIFLEYHDWIKGESSEKLAQTLKSHGYKVERYPSSKIKELGFLWCYKLRTKD